LLFRTMSMTDATKRKEPEQEEAKADAPKIAVAVKPTAASDEPDAKRLKTSPADMATVRKQVEYYMSDVNLKRDVFFQKEMAKNDGNVGVDCLLKCNKLKKLCSDADAIMAALEASEALIISDCKKKVKRKTPPPPLDADVAKREKQRQAKAEKKGEAAVDDDALKKAIEEKAIKAVEDRIVFKVEGVPAGTKWTELKDAVKEATKIEAKFFIQHEDGATEAKLSCMKAGNEDKFTKCEAIKIGDAALTLTRLEDKAELQEYWVQEFTKNPPKELEKELKKKAHQQNKPNKAGKKRKGTEKSGPLTVAGVEYQSKDDVMAKAMEIVKRNPDQELQVLEGDEKAFAASLLDFHPKAEEKKKALKDFAVGTNPEHPTTRCFFAVQDDGTKVDFSYIKCVEAGVQAAQSETKDNSEPAAKKAKAEETAE